MNALKRCANAVHWWLHQPLGGVRANPIPPFTVSRRSPEQQRLWDKAEEAYRVLQQMQEQQDLHEKGPVSKRDAAMRSLVEEMRLRRHRQDSKWFS
ncbi:hypothetical protein FPSE_08219 [Fusarium pseudograminearum CS3096]|uniref:Uncharacterized protein n=1 Tax=Fusarium pseudograminearum (strain CS3096) TaxID=1028729 RepID=K3VZ09_FUSPC|nr:hypothetical protein FPSE_08219 [Fusarium pseudograminearum CS3096]EKJ71580.1 hypothetical protein FPSE_08219 [Fusarium pseudograminearum CS3096]